MSTSTNTLSALSSSETQELDRSVPEQGCRAVAAAPEKLPYCISPFVYACHTNHGTVFLDLPRNKYLGLPTNQARELSALVEAWPAASCDGEDARPRSSTEDAKKLADALVGSGLLSHGQHNGASILSRVVHLDGDLTSIGEEIEYDVRVGARHIVNFIYACAYSKYTLRRRQLHSAAIKRHAKRLARGSDRPTFDAQRAGELVCVFRTLRPYFFAANGKCLFHALALATFLECYDQFPAWVFGVRTNPWGAHSWVQEGNLVLDTNPEKVCDFTPIFAV